VSISENLPVQSIQDLSTNLAKQASDLNTTITSLRQAVQKDPNFTGNAADKYEGFMVKWGQSQQQMIEAIQGAGDLLAKYAAKLTELGVQVGHNFDI
jgi:uncharacterized protein YukE